MAAAMTGKEQLEAFISRYTPEVAACARRALATMRRRLPGAVELVYDNYNALVIGFVSHRRVSHAEQIAESALVHQVEARLVTMEQTEPGGVGHLAEGPGNAGGLGRGRLVFKGGLEPLVLDGPEPPEAPMRCDHLFNEGLLDFIVGIEAVEVPVHHVVKRFGGLLSNHDVFGQQAVGDGIHRRPAFSLGSDGAARMGAVGAGGESSFLRVH